MLRQAAFGHKRTSTPLIMSVPINHLIAEFRVNKELIVSNVDKTHLSLLSSIGVLSEISFEVSGFVAIFLVAHQFSGVIELANRIDFRALFST